MLHERDASIKKQPKFYTNHENLAKIGPVDAAIIDLTKSGQADSRIDTWTDTRPLIYAFC